MVYTVTFNPAVDYIVHTKELRAGATNRSDSEEIYFGGKGINVSIVLSELGVKSKALGFVAGFTGAAIEQGVSEKGIDADFVHLSGGFSRINVKIKSDEETELNGQGPKIPDEAVQQLFAKLDELQDGDTLVLAGSIPSSLPSDIYERILARLSGRKIPLIARIITVSDVFDALTSNRPYRRPWSVAETEEYMLGGCGVHFDYDVVAAFLRSFNPYPVGTMVSLSDGRHAVVVRHNTNVLRPVVRIRGGNSAEEIDLSNDFRFLSLMITGIYSGSYNN